MEIDFQKLMTNKSDEGIQEYLDNRAKFTPEAVEAAIAEFQKRGRTFSDEELNTYRQEFQQRSEAAEKEVKELFPSGNQWKKNVVTDENAPAYYSEKAIYLFAVIFSVVFGSIILALNFSKTETKKGVWEVVIFGAFFTSLQIWILSMIPRNNGLTLVFNMVGALILNQFFWKKYIGNDTKYRTKPIWIPMIVGILITIPILLAIIYGGAESQ